MKLFKVESTPKTHKIKKVVTTQQYNKNLNS